MVSNAGSSAAPFSPHHSAMGLSALHLLVNI